MPAKDTIKILLVDDSSTVRNLFKKFIHLQNDMSVVGVAGHGIEALEFLKDHAVDLILLDIEMPKMDGLTFLPLCRKQYPKTKIIMISSLTHKGAEITVKALVMGAADYVTKPSGTDLHQEMIPLLISKIRALFASSLKKTPIHLEIAKKSSLKILKNMKALVIGASTGGPNALILFLKALPKQFSSPILIVQHMPKNFIQAMSERIFKETSYPCFPAKHLEAVEPRKIYLAPGDRHMTIEGSRKNATIYLKDGPEENFCKPAVDPLFRSAATIYKTHLVAVVLTGMGSDGCLGSAEIVKQGGVVLAQDEASSVVWGMPGCVVQKGLAAHIASPKELADLVGGLEAVG